VEDFCRRVQGGLDPARFEQKRHLVEVLVDRVVVTDGAGELRYVIPTTPASEQVHFCHLRTGYFDQRPLTQQQVISEREEPVAHVLAQLGNQPQPLFKEQPLSEWSRDRARVTEQSAKEAADQTRHGTSVVGIAGSDTSVERWVLRCQLQER
jgi:hypothetical protein